MIITEVQRLARRDVLEHLLEEFWYRTPLSLIRDVAVAMETATCRYTRTLGSKHGDLFRQKVVDVAVDRLPVYRLTYVWRFADAAWEQFVLSGLAAVDLTPDDDHYCRTFGWESVDV